MNRKYKHKDAKDESGNVIHVSDAKKGMQYYCTDPECNKEIIYRDSGKTGKGSKRPHFSHKKGTNPNCSPERALHNVFQNRLVDLLEKHKTEKCPFVFSWKCGSCKNSNSGNLLEKVNLIKKEHPLAECRPDIALLDNENNVLAVIEIVVTHPPEDKVLKYYEDQRIVHIQIDLTSDEDSNRVEELAKNPTIVDFCMNQTCQSINRYNIKRRIIRLEHYCGRCPSRILKFEVEIDGVFGVQQSLRFTKEENEFVKNKFQDIVINKRINKLGIEEEYPVMECLNCKRLRSRYARRGRL
jgi:hypothetical protein